MENGPEYSMYDLNGNGKTDIGDHMLHDIYFNESGGGSRNSGSGSGCGTMVLMAISVLAVLVWLIQ